MQAQVEMTDTFGGQANYSWVKHATISTPEYDTRQPLRYQAAVMRLAKAAMGMTSVRGVTDDSGGMLTFRPYGMCVIIFVTWEF